MFFDNISGFLCEKLQMVENKVCVKVEDAPANTKKTNVNKLNFFDNMFYSIFLPFVQNAFSIIFGFSPKNAMMFSKKHDCSL